MTDLIPRLSAATAPDRELDAEIALALGIAPDGAFRPCASPDAGTFGTGLHTSWRAPAFTASIDAVLTLMPERWRVTQAYWGGRTQATFCLTFGQGKDARYAEGCAATPAIAFVIAILKARQS